MKKLLYMLDTNMVSFLIKGEHIVIKDYLRNVAMSAVCISVITEAELLRGLAKKPSAKNLQTAVKEFLIRVEILPWDSGAAQAYADLRTICEKEGKSLGAMDMLIAAHSVAVDAILITNDQAFYKLKNHLTLQDWTKSKII
ncbi:MAG: type II toxin-antitoxin system VapC family toxin [SAR324 cluster bacterium]|nr:type II toxin-antitoxin system VapC family toxin [SAR324 cluster bacterium]